MESPPIIVSLPGEKIPMASPRAEAGNMSAMTPPALVKGEEPVEPASNRSTRRVAIPLSAVHAAEKMLKSANETKNTFSRP